MSVVAGAATENSTDATPPAYAFNSREYTSNTPYLQVTDSVRRFGADLITQVQFFYRYSATTTAPGRHGRHSRR